MHGAVTLAFTLGLVWQGAPGMASAWIGIAAHSVQGLFFAVLMLPLVRG